MCIILLLPVYSAALYITGQEETWEFSVDVHVHHITNRLKWHKPPTKNPEETEEDKTRIICVLTDSVFV